MATIVTFGEVMLRLKPPGCDRFLQSQALEATFGGGESNVAVSLAQFGHTGRFVTALPANPIGDWCLSSLRRYGVDTGAIVRRGERVGIYFLEAGASQRPSNVVYDRAGSAIAECGAGVFDWYAALQGAQWFHLTGITPALSDAAAAAAEEALRAAKAAGCTVSLDLNFRKKLWTSERANAVMSGLMPWVDVAVGNEEDAEKVFGIQAGHNDVTGGALDHERYKDVAAQLRERFPSLSRVAITLRESISASRNGWSAMLVDEDGVSFSRRYDITIVDRVGGGDSFAAGLIHALLAGKDRQSVIEFAVAASCLKHSISGDLNLVTVDEVERLAGGDASGRVQR